MNFCENTAKSPTIHAVDFDPRKSRGHKESKGNNERQPVWLVLELASSPALMHGRKKRLWGRKGTEIKPTSRAVKDGLLCEHLDMRDRRTANARDLLHDLILRQACGLGLHSIQATRSLVLDEGQSKWAPAVLVPREFFDRSISTLSRVKSNDTCSSRPPVWFILDLSLFNLSDGGEKLNEVLVARRPGKLSGLLAGNSMQGSYNTYVTDVNGLASLRSASGVVGEGVRSSCWDSSIEATAGGSSVATAKATTAAKPSAKTTASSKGATRGPEASSKATTTAAKSTAATESGSRTCKAVLADFEGASLPVIPVELLNGVTSVVWGFECNNARTFGATIRPNVDVGTDDSTVTS